MGGIVAIDSLRKQLEDKQVEALRWETRCDTVTKTVTNMEKLLADIHSTIRRLDEELHNVHKWNNFYDGNLQDAYRTLSMLKEDRDKKRRQYEEDSDRMRKRISQQQKECELRKENLDRNIELVWKKIPSYALKVEKEETIKSLTDQLNNMGIQNVKTNTEGMELSEELKKLNSQKTERISVLKQKKQEYENLGKKIIEQKMINTSKNDEMLKLRNTLDQLRKQQIIFENAGKDQQNSICESVQPHQLKSTKSSSDCQGSDGESGFLSMNEGSSKSAENIANISAHDQSLDNTMFEFEDMESRNKAEVMKTPSKKPNVTVPGPMHSTPHSFTSKLSGFLRPQQSKHCSAPPNVTPINNTMLSKSSNLITPINTLSKLTPRNNIGKIQGLRNSTPLKTPMKNTLTTANKAEITPVKSNFMLSLPKTPVSSVSNCQIVESKSLTSEYAMNKGLLAPTPEKDNVLHITPTKEIESMPIAPSAPVKVTQDNQFLSVNSQPDSKKLKPSNSFTKVQKPMSPRSIKDTPSNAAPQETNQTKPMPNERGDEAAFSSAVMSGDATIRKTNLHQMPTQKDNLGAIETVTPQKDDTSKRASPFGFNFGGDSAMEFAGTGSAFGGDTGFNSGSGFGDGSQFAGSAEFGSGSGFGGSDFGESPSGFGGASPAGFGASGDNSNFGSGFGGFNF